MFKLGQRVRYIAGGKWKPYGKVISIQPEVTQTIGGETSVLVSAYYKVQWEADEQGGGGPDDVSGWLSGHNLEAA